MKKYSRRTFIAGSGMAAACATHPLFALPAASRSPFKVSVITDEISPDFDHACSVIVNDFGLHWIELRALWGKNLQELSDDQLADGDLVSILIGKRQARFAHRGVHLSG